jgi:hypothetical protein
MQKYLHAEGCIRTSCSKIFRSSLEVRRYIIRPVSEAQIRSTEKTSTLDHASMLLSVVGVASIRGEVEALWNFDPAQQQDEGQDSGKDGRDTF